MVTRPVGCRPLHIAGFTASARARFDAKLPIGLGVPCVVTESEVRILLIEDNPGDAELVKEALSTVQESHFHLYRAEALLPGLDRLARGDIDLVLLDVHLPDSQGLDGLNAIRLHAPGTPVVLLTGWNSEALSLQAVQGGAQDYVVKGTLEGPALARVIQHAIFRQRTQAESRTASRQDPATVLGFLSAKGGVGSTTIACHLAMELKRQTGGEGLVMDLDMAGNAVALLMNANASYGILDASDNILNLDKDRWAKLTAKGPGGVDIIRSGGPAMREDKLPRADRVRVALRFVRSLYRWIVVDLGRLSPFSARIAEEIGRLFIVSTGDVLGLREAKSAVHALIEAGFARDRLSLIINQTADRPPFTREDLQRAVGVPVEAMMPECRQDFERAFLEGKSLGESRKFQKHLADLASGIAGVKKSVLTEKAHLPFLMGVFRNVTAGN